MNIAVKQYHASDHAGAMDTIHAMETGNWDTRPRAGWPGGDQPSYPVYTSLAYRYIADLQAAAGDFSKAEATCGRADPHDQVGALNVLAWMEAMAGKKDAALAHAEKIVKLCTEGRARKNDPPRIGDIALLQVLLGDNEGAKKTDELFPGEVYTAASVIKSLKDAQDPKAYKEYLPLHHFDFSSEEDRLAGVAGERRIFHRRPKSAVSDAIYLINNDLSSELFTNPQGALRAIAETPHRKTQFYEPERNEQFEGMEEAILQMADRLGNVMRLGR